MSRFLFVVPPFVGHVNPTVAVARELTGRGHEVAWTGLPGVTEALLPPGSPFLAAAPDAVGEEASHLAERPPELRGAAALKFLWFDALLPLAQHMVDGVDDAVDEFRPDVLVVDQQAFAGAVVARRRKLPWATSATTSAELVEPLAALPAVAAELSTALQQLQIDHGIDAERAAEVDLRASPELVLAFTTTALAGDGPFPPATRFVGPSVAPPTPGDFPWEWLDAGDGPVVLVSLGTLNATAGDRFWAAAAEACRDQPWRAVFVAPPELVPDAPANVLVRERIPQVALLERVDAVVSHAGHNTVCEALAAGLPLVVAPIRDDQPIVAGQVVDAGAGVRLTFSRVRPDGLRAAIDQALTDPALRDAAGAISRSFHAAGGPAAAATLLEELA